MSKINDLVFRAIVPRRLRPETPKEIDAMLDSMNAGPLPEATVQRMLGKIKNGLAPSPIETPRGD